MEDRKIIKRNNLEDYKKIFFSRYENSNQSFLEFLYFERDKFEQILNLCYQETVNALLEDAELDSEKSELYKLFGETFFKILNEIKNEIFDLKFYSDEDVMEFIEDVLSTHNIYILDDEFHDPVPYRVDRLVDFLSQYICMLFIPELFVKENKIIQFLNLEIIQEEIKIKSKGSPTSFEQNILIPQSEETPEEKVAKVKFILLKELGIIDFLQSQNYNNEEIGKILLPITKTKISYTKNILSADYKTPDTTSDKTAYKKKNVSKALEEFVKMGISFEQLKYLPKIKIENPNLFEKE